MSLELKLLGQHEGRVVVLEEPLLVEPRVQVGDGLVEVIDPPLKAAADTLLRRHVRQEGSRYAAMEPKVHTLQEKGLIKIPESAHTHTGKKTNLVIYYYSTCYATVQPPSP